MQADGWKFKPTGELRWIGKNGTEERRLQQRGLAEQLGPDGQLLRSEMQWREVPVMLED
jgi:hypothetical protein